MAKAVKLDLLEITKDESEQLGAAITRVTELYDVPIMSEKSMAFVNLGMVMASIYGTRAMVIAAQKVDSKKSPNVVTMPFSEVAR